LSDAEKELARRDGGAFRRRAKEDIEWNKPQTTGSRFPKAFYLLRTFDLARLYARSALSERLSGTLSNAYHWMESDWLDVLNDDNAFDAFMSMQRRYYEDCLDDSELIGQTAECAGWRKPDRFLKKTDDVFGSVVPTDTSD